MSLVSFKKGLKANLSPSIDGAIYLATDTGELFLYDNSSSIKISDIISVAEESDLPAAGTEIPTKLYYVEETNGLYKVINNQWSKTTAEQVAAGAGLTYSIDGTTLKAKLKSETQLGASEAAAATATSGRFYPVQVDSSGYLAVNVPWTDSGATGSVQSVNGQTGTVVLDADDVGAIDSSLKGANSGVAELDSSGKVPTTQMPTYVSSVNSSSGAVTLTASDVSAIASTEKGANSGVAELDSSGKVPTSQMPTYVSSVNSASGAVTLGASDVGAIASTEKGANSGVAELDASGKVPSSQLPSYVDDVEEYADSDHFPTTGESGKIYIALDTNVTYRWGGSTYVVIGSSLALGETDSTAYRGDRGATAYNHSQNSGATTTYASDLYKVTVNSMGHVTGATAVQKSDITALGIPGSDTTYESKSASSGGTDVSLVTTGEKYTWNNKTDNTGTVTQVSTGAGLTGGDITTSGTIKAKLKSETELGASEAAASVATSGRFYPVQLDSSGNLAVNVPWSDTQPAVTSVNSETGAVVLDASDVGAIASTEKGANNGVAELDSSGKVPTTQMPTYVSSVNSASGAVTLGASDVGAIASTEKGANSGVAELDSSGKVPTTQMPTYVSSVNNASGAVTLGASDVGAIASTEKGANSGVAELDANGKVPSSQLPSYVDDVEEYADSEHFPATGESGKIYIALDTNVTYRWGGSSYVVIGSSLALGETESTAYRGDRGASAYAHAVTNKGSAFSSGLYKITTNSEGHVTAATAVQKSDITALDIPGSDTTYTASSGIEVATGNVIQHTNSVTAGSTSSSSGQLSNGGTLNLPKVNYDAQGHITSVETTSCTLPSISSGVTSITAGDGLSGGTITATGTISLPTTGTGAGTSGSTTAQSPAFGGTATIPYITTDAYGRVSARGTANLTIPSSTATASAAGLMSANDKSTLDTLAQSTMTSITSDPASTSTTSGASAKLCNYLAGELKVFTISTSNWSSSRTITINSKTYYYYDYAITTLMVSHPIMLLATDTLPTDAQASAWSDLQMNAYSSYLRFYVTTIPTVNIPVAVKGVV